jgi:glucose-1-phosphate thymidylyltransferase
MWGIVPAAGRGTRIQPLAFSKELLPVGGKLQGSTQRPCAVSEYLVQRMIRAGADKICFVIAPGKTDIMAYYGREFVCEFGSAKIAYVVQDQPSGLCDAVFTAGLLVAPDETVVVGLPDTVWFPDDALCALPATPLSFLLFPVTQPELFDAVLLSDDDQVREIRVKQRDPGTQWIWGAFKMPGEIFHQLHRLWLSRDKQDEYFGSLVNAYITAGGVAVARKAGHTYIDVGTLSGYRSAMRMLIDTQLSDSAETPLANIAYEHRLVEQRP